MRGVSYLLTVSTPYMFCATKVTAPLAHQFWLTLKAASVLHNTRITDTNHFFAADAEEHFYIKNSISALFENFIFISL